MDLRELFIADTEAAELMQPGEGAFDDPAASAKAAAVFCASFGWDWLDLSPLEFFSMGLGVIGPVALGGIRPLAGASWFSPDRGGWHQQEE